MRVIKAIPPHILFCPARGIVPRLAVNKRKNESLRHEKTVTWGMLPALKPKILGWITNPEKGEHTY